MKSTITNSNVSIRPSKDLIETIKALDHCTDMPLSFISLRMKKSQQASSSYKEYNSLISYEDRRFIESLHLASVNLEIPPETSSIEHRSILLSTDDLLWLLSKLQKGDQSVYLHELLFGCEVILPCNEEIPRNEDLDKRCQKLKIQQENRAYNLMTKNVDNVRKQYPEDTISYQLKLLNRQLIAVAQFIITVICGFMFGFQGIELLVGPLDFGFRLLLGVMCSLIIALAELYFLAKSLNEELHIATSPDEKRPHAKVD